MRDVSSNAEPTLSADEALNRLKAGNERFVAGTARFPSVQKEILADPSRGQHPYATILSCSDSRVPPELVFDAGFGELFIIRVAGNVMSPEVAGSLQYAGRHLQTPLFIVLGHTGCGAVAVAIDSRLHGTRQLSRIQILVSERFGIVRLSRQDTQRFDGCSAGTSQLQPAGVSRFAQRRKLTQERLYTTATVMASPRTGADSGEFTDLSELTSLKTFVTSFAGHIAAEAAR